MLLPHSLCFGGFVETTACIDHYQIMTAGAYAVAGPRKSKLRKPFSPSLAALISLAVFPSLTMAAPQGGNVASGNATIVAKPNGVTVNQTSNKTIINWQSFSVAPNETVRFNLPSSLSAVLNRVIGSDPSLIAGRMS